MLKYDVEVYDALKYDVEVYDALKYDFEVYDALKYDVEVYDALKYDVEVYDALKLRQVQTTQEEKGQRMIYKTLHIKLTQTPLKTRGELRCQPSCYS